MPVEMVAFDIGGVLATINKRTLQSIFGPNMLKNIFFDQSFAELQQGLLPPHNYLEKICARLSISPSSLKNLFLDMLHAHHNARFLQKLRCPYIFASNINSLHYQKFIGQVKPNTHALLNSALSYQLGVLKPDAAFFDNLVSQSDLKAEQIIFIDDKISNIKAALKFGLCAAWCKRPESLGALLTDAKLIVKSHPA